ncbi:hypothetical protein AOLI_G00066450 [Acnodon oligacanthus]
MSEVGVNGVRASAEQGGSLYMRGSRVRFPAATRERSTRLITPIKTDMLQQTRGINLRLAFWSQGNTCSWCFKREWYTPRGRLFPRPIKRDLILTGSPEDNATGRRPLVLLPSMIPTPFIQSTYQFPCVAKMKRQASIWKNDRLLESSVPHVSLVPEGTSIFTTT